ncbi:MFS general substrate transporter [Amniculicola lignicola CBS 123094]|uniref:MFS general substrate transporter n=1 Tax=Amniculicola lignicola CBS 123094 TaxID=1392246 RepID=A0A6A5WSF7_9PLEO|nr:MFS general substrate transporter [Amniculicola lignicola CBS 123094]
MGRIGPRPLVEICITYTIQFLDKLSLNYASAYTLIPDLGLEGQRYSWTAAIFNFGYLFWALPANYLIQRLPVSKYTGTMILIWSILLCCHVAAKNYTGILVLRFFLGMFEASISPAIMNIVSMFYARNEQPLRMCIFLAFNGMATMVGALLGYGLGHVNDAKIASWQLIFLVIGLINFVWSWVFLWQRIVAIDRIAGNMIGVKTKQFQPRQATEAVLDIKVFCLALIGLGCGVINGGVSNFASALIKGFGFSGIYATLLQLPTGAFEFVLVPICGLAAGYFKNSRCIILALICLPPLGGLIGIRLTPLTHRWSLVGCTWLQFLIGAPVILSWNLLTTNIAGHTKRSTANGLWFCFYAGGNIAGANIFFAKEKPRYFSALTGLIVCYCGLAVISLFLMGYMKWENVRRDKKFGAGEDGEAITEGFMDMTDKGDKHFRYAM